jgi:hypothetical protein
MDKDWWSTYEKEVFRDFLGAAFSCNKIKNVNFLENFEHFGNSGAACIILAIMAGAERVILLGFDCQKTNGQSHWHGDHPKNLGNANVIDKWHKRFKELSEKHPNIIFNASRSTALECFPKVKLEDEIA